MRPADRKGEADDEKRRLPPPFFPSSSDRRGEGRWREYKKYFPLVECVANTGQQTAADNRYLSPGTGLHTH